MKKILVTSALPYVNNVPHLGNLVGSTLSADVYARHKRLQGCEVLYICGADEHGTTTEMRARQEGVTPQELCDRYGTLQKELYDWFHISFDIWGRTHTDTHNTIVQEIFTALQERGYIKKQTVEHLFDEQEQQFLADRFVEGDCPYCGAPGARGDQCDACQKLITATQLKNPVSKLSETTPVRKKTTHLFLDLPALTPLITEWANTTQHRFSDQAQAITQEWLKELKPRAITRDLEWGVPVPGMEGKVFYVWFDAPIGYISITAHVRDDWEDWWKNPDVELVQFMGKDNVVFHTILFPATQLGTEEHWNTADAISATDYLNLEQGKFSKSRQTGVFLDNCKELEVPADVWRYYLMAVRPETADSTFSFDDFQARINHELIDNFANLVHRTTHFAHTKLKAENGELTKAHHAFLREIRERYETIHELLDKQRLRAALQEIMKVAKNANAHFQHQEPWKTIQENPARAAADIRALLTVLQDLSVLLAPYLPETTARVLKLLDVEDADYTVLSQTYDKPFSAIKQPEPLFDKLEDDYIQELKTRFLPQTHPLDLRVAEITDATDHPNADKLLLLKLRVGSEERQLVAGLKGHYTPEELVGKRIIIVYNLAPAKLRGEISQGMLLASEKEGEVGILHTTATSGTKLTIGTAAGQEDTITFDEFQTHAITATSQGVYVDGTPLKGAPIVVDKEAFGSVR